MAWDFGFLGARSDDSYLVEKSLLALRGLKLKAHNPAVMQGSESLASSFYLAPPCFNLSSTSRTFQVGSYRFGSLTVRRPIYPIEAL